MQDFDVIIIGGGAAGLMCACTAGLRGRRVLVIERSNKVGKKILMSGGGRCNFTNLDIRADCYLSENPHFCKSALARYTQWDFIALVEQYGISYHEKKDGQLFCDNSSKDILHLLLAECEKAGVILRTQCIIEHIEKKSHFELKTNLGNFTAESIVIASGGLSIPKMGASGFGYQVAKQFGLFVLPTRAALVPFTFTDNFKLLSEKLSGLSVNASVQCSGQHFNNAILFTHRGLSGPAILQLSSYWHEGEAVELNLLPKINAYEYLTTLKNQQPNKLLRNLLSQHLPKNLVLELQTLFWPNEAELPMQALSKQDIANIAAQLNNWSLKPASTEGYRTAEVTLGGVDTLALSSKTFESKTQPGLFFIGEVVDVTGHLGGFNFQWAWSSGYTAGQYV